MTRQLLIIGAVVAALCVVLYAVENFGYGRAETKYLLKISEDKLTATAALQAAQKKADEKFRAQTTSVNQLTEQFIAAKVALNLQTQKLNERAKDVSTLYRAAPDAPFAAVPGWIVTNGWVCDYNRAIGAVGYGVPESGASASGTDGSACQADAFAPSAITAEQILMHHEAYGAYTRTLEKQVNLLIDYANIVDGGKP